MFGRVTVVLKAGAVGVAREIEPEARLALAIARRSEQAVDELLIGVGAGSLTKAATSSGVGMRPQASSVARRMKVARSASGDGVRPRASILESTKASKDERVQSFFCTLGAKGW